MFGTAILFIFVAHLYRGRTYFQGEEGSERATAENENWSLPLAVILIVPMCLWLAIAGVYFRGQDNNIFTQIGF